MQFKAQVLPPRPVRPWAQGERGAGTGARRARLCRAFEADELREAHDLRRRRTRPVRRDPEQSTATLDAAAQRAGNSSGVERCLAD